MAAEKCLLDSDDELDQGAGDHEAEDDHETEGDHEVEDKTETEADHEIEGDHEVEDKTEVEDDHETEGDHDHETEGETDPEVKTTRKPARSPAKHSMTLQSTQNAINPLLAFLNRYKTKDKDFTHTWLGHPKASYNIPDKDMPKLFELLHQRCFVDQRDTYLTERPCDPSNLKIDLDFRYEMDAIRKRIHTPEQIQEVVQLYNQIITEYLDVTEEQLKAYVFERRCGYQLNGYTRDGVHIMYPEIVAPVSAQHAIRKRVLELCEPILSKLPLTNCKEEVVDKAVISDNNWLTYGSTKPALPPYRLTHIYDHQLEDLPILGDHAQLLIQLSNFNPAKNQHLTAVRASKQEEVAYLDLHRHAKPKKTQLNLAKQKKNYLEQNQYTGSNFEEILQLIKMLSPYRAESYSDWIQVGWCLHNIDYRLLSEWIEFSKLSEKFKEGVCDELWAGFRDEGYHLGSLHRWARADSPDLYEAYRRESLSSYIEKSISGTTYDVAVVVYQMYKHDYVCASIKHNIWYEFKNHRWREVDQGSALRRHLSNDVLNEYGRLIIKYNQCALGEKDEFKDQHIVKSKQMTDVSYKLRDWTFKEKVMNECRLLFHDPEFCNRLDVNPHLVGFENGVYDLKHNEFRNGRPEDYISLSTLIDYAEYDRDAPEMIELFTYLDQVFPITRVRNYVLILLGSFLLGSNPDEKFHLWVGTGANSKSKLVELFESSFGEYTCKLPVSLLTQKRGSSNQASPELSRTKGVRFISLQEPDENERFNIGLLKELTGGDKIQCRPMYRDPIEFKPQFKMVLCCNHLPKVPPNDDGTWRRLRVVDFIAKFVDASDLDPSKPYQFVKDPHLIQKFPGWRQAFIYTLIQYYKVYATEGVIEPPEVKAATREYQRISDIFAEFRDDSLEPCPDSAIRIEELYKKFREWYKASYEGKVPPRKEFRGNMEKHLGVQYNIRKGFEGWKFVVQDDGLQIDQLGPTENGIPDNITPILTPKLHQTPTIAPQNQRAQQVYPMHPIHPVNQVHPIHPVINRPPVAVKQVTPANSEPVFNRAGMDQAQMTTPVEPTGIISPKVKLPNLKIIKRI